MAVRRTFAMGDPQAPEATLRAILARHGALAGDRLAADVALISIGDHFDYDRRDPDTAGDNGLAFLGWLASHPADQVHLLLGNHDAARVMELAAISDARFRAARALAAALDGAPDADARFAAAFPELPTPGLAGRDYASFSTDRKSVV